MEDNSASRTLDVFFYGLYMDPDVLRQKGVEPRNPRPAYVPHYRLRIGNKATLLRDRDSKSYGIVYALSHQEIDRLYSGLDEYYPEALSAILMASEQAEPIPVLCCVLLEPPAEAETNPRYTELLTTAMQKLDLPTDF